MGLKCKGTAVLDAACNSEEISRTPVKCCWMSLPHPVGLQSHHNQSSKHTTVAPNACHFGLWGIMSTILTPIFAMSSKAQDRESCAGRISPHTTPIKQTYEFATNFLLPLFKNHQDEAVKFIDDELVGPDAIISQKLHEKAAVFSSSLQKNTQHTVHRQVGDMPTDINYGNLNKHPL
ncbi:hypothetical protein Pelo_1804 [Pelomyxa schiedti]|nr:hypothetical protein Pelo_1804 [Pelomyxa schiedti]